MTKNKCVDCGTKVEGKRHRCSPCAKKWKVILNRRSINRLKNKPKKTKSKLLKSMNGNLPLNEGIIAHLMANGYNAGY